MSTISMTGFGAGIATEGNEEISVEARSVNGKFCEVKVRLPRELASLEADVVKFVKERLSRGNVDVSIRRTSALGLEAEPKVNAVLLAAYAKAFQAAAASASLSPELSIRDLIDLDGVVRLEERPPDLAAVAKALNGALATALSALISARQREGVALAADLKSRLQTLRKLAAQAAVGVPASIAQYRERLRNRIKEIANDIEVDPQRLEQEVILFAERTDVAEELTRLGAHFDEFDRLLEKSGPVGRQLDFLIQEINREVNTTGSKSQATELARLVVEMKTEIERIREQVQNVE
jgi:uncharacterized protein (TIGR00255 family)